MKVNRRKLLQSGAALAGVAIIRPAFEIFAAERFAEPAKSRFALPLRIPPTLHPIRRDETTDFYHITQKEAYAEILPGKKTKIWGYEGMFPGPTIRTSRGRKVVVRHTNGLSVHTAVHLHGGVTAPEHDGFPMDMMMPGESRAYEYLNQGRGTTLWYHDHAMDHTGRNVYMGLAGLYLIQDEEEAALRMPSGEFDIPLLIQSHTFAEDGSISYHAGPGGRIGAFGNTILVNGVPWPRLEVAARKYRFRILNAANARAFRFALSDGKPLIQIATDGGLLNTPMLCDSLPLVMAERVEVVVDFSKYPVGSRVVLRNLEENGPMGDVLQFEVMRKESDDSVLPQKLADISEVQLTPSLRERTFDFSVSPSLGFPFVAWTINGKRFDPEASLADVPFGDLEVWRLRNSGFGPLSMLHPVHIHLGHFQILERDGQPPHPWEKGWKDTISLRPGEEAKVIMKFDGYRGRYLIHCHNLEHEDHSMMARFDVV
jgi:spore coat protein A, manganese oxidase